MRIDARRCFSVGMLITLLAFLSAAPLLAEEPAPQPSVADDAAAPPGEQPSAPGAVDDESAPPEPPADDADAPAPAEGDEETPGAAESTEPTEPVEPDDAAVPVEPAKPAPPQGPPIEAASFKGVRAGFTLREELHTKWGQPEKVDRIPGGVRETFKSDAFEFVRATIIEDVVETLLLKLQAPIAADSVVARLDVGDVEPVDVYDQEGRPLGYAYPERGMMFGLAGRTDRPLVSHIVIAAVDEQPFLARAEIRLATRYVDCLADAQQALRLAPECGRAYWFCAQVHLRTGNLEQALESAKKAVELSPAELEYRLTLSEILSQSGDHRQAIDHARQVAEAAGAPALLLAKGCCQWGDCVAAAPERRFAEAIDHHLRAVKLAEPLTQSPKVDIRRGAKRVLVDAYLGAARDVGLGHWRHQAAVVPKWLDKAAAAADDLIAHERGGAEVRLQVFAGALAALAGVADPPDATRWIRGATELGAIMVNQANDSLYKSHVAWRMGVALGDATEIETARGRPEEAMQLGKLAMQYFDLGDEAGKGLPNHDYLRGWVCYRMGAIHAVGAGDHQQAAAWFEHAVPLLESPTPASATVSTGRLGETFVSMAVSYWELDNRQEALRLTEQGLKLMQRASTEGQLRKSALAVPYANLARMHQLQGDLAKAKEYTELAARAKAMAVK